MAAMAGIEPAPINTSLTYTFSAPAWVRLTQRVSRAEALRSTGELHHILLTALHKQAWGKSPQDDQRYALTLYKKPVLVYPIRIRPPID